MLPSETENTEATIGGTLPPDTGSEVVGTNTGSGGDDDGVKPEPTGEEVTPPNEEPSPDGDVTYTYNGEEVSVDIPDDLIETFSKSGLDAKALAAELYSGEFGLSEETLGKLHAVYGKTVVNGYLDSIKAQNDAIFKARADGLAAHEAAEAKLWEDTLASVGGEENWGKLENFALETLDDAALAEFNAVMDGGNRYAQKLAIKDLMSQFEDKHGTGELKLIDGTSAPAQAPTALSKAEFLKLVASGEYRKNPQQYDAMRLEGMRRGL